VNGVRSRSRFGRRLQRLHGRGHRAVTRALEAIEDAGSTLIERRAVLALRDSAATGPDADRDAAGHRRDWLRPIGSGLIAVNAGGTTLMLVLPAGTGNDVTIPVIGVAVALGLLSGSAQAVLAAALGVRIRETRPVASSRSRPYRGPTDRWLLVGGGVLAVMCTTASWATYTWVQDRIGDGHGDLAALLGVGLGLQAWVAPWLLLAHTAGTPSAGQHELEVLDRRAAELAAEWRHRIAGATRALETAEASLMTSRQLVRSAGAARRASWDLLVDQLAAAVATARAALRSATPGDSPQGPALGRGDVDLAG
jgi:hypothetical protein